MTSSKEIIEIFSYSSKEQETFPYLRRYMKRISKKLPVIENNPDKLRKFALAELFLTYRAFNHWGRAMSTNLSEISPEGEHYERLKAFKDYFGLEIKDTEHYFSMMSFSKLDLLLMMLRISDISKRLYSFVVK
jgi:hypothetical protein